MDQPLCVERLDGLDPTNFCVVLQFKKGLNYYVFDLLDDAQALFDIDSDSDPRPRKIQTGVRCSNKGMLFNFDRIMPSCHHP